MIQLSTVGFRGIESLTGFAFASMSSTHPQAALRDVPQAEVIVFDDCGHFPDLENPQRFAQILLKPLAISTVGGDVR